MAANEYDDTGINGFGAMADQAKRMSRRQLLDVGLDDALLESEREKFLGKRPEGTVRLEPEKGDTQEMMVERRSTYDALLYFWHGPVAPAEPK